MSRRDDADADEATSLASPSTPGVPDAEVEIDVTDVRRLLAAQHPDLAALPLEPLAHGWDNVLFRLGETRIVRLPRRAAAVALVLNEQRWLPELRDRLPIPIPSPERIGVGDADHPWPWSVLPWLPGECADRTPPRAEEATRFADFLRALHVPAPDRAPLSPVRGVPLARREGAFHERLARVAARVDDIDVHVRSLWDAALAAPVAREALWLHGDLHAQNVLVDGGRLSAVIDWGDVTAGDVATDLAGVWSIFDTPGARALALDRYGPDEATLARAKGWAVLFSIALIDAGSVDSPRHAAQGHALLSRLREGP